MNWGNRLLVVFVLFGILICTLVYRSMRAQVELVSRDYYREELAYQTIIDSKNNTLTLSSPVKVNLAEGQVLVSFPSEVRGANVTGTVWFYCPSNSSKDKKLPLTIDEEGNQLIPASFASSGNYVVKLDWEQGGKKYFQEERLIIP